MASVKVRVRIHGGLAFVETELGQKAVVPVESLCNFLDEYGLEVAESNVEVKCARGGVRKQRVVEVEYDSEEED